MTVAKRKELDRLMQETLERTGVTKLRAQGRRGERPDFPDLSVEQRTAPCSNGFGKTTGKRELPPDAQEFTVINSHKQGYMVGTPFDFKHGREFTGGKKTG
jgi:hypothetical protein